MRLPKAWPARPASSVDAAPRADGHVGALGQQHVDQLRRVFRRIGTVAVGHQVDVGIDVGEHAPHHIALALARLPDDDGAGGARLQRRQVARIVVVDIDRSGGQRLAEAPHHVARSSVPHCSKARARRSTVRARRACGISIAKSWRSRVLPPMRLRVALYYLLKRLRLGLGEGTDRGSCASSRIRRLYGLLNRVR